MTKFIPGVLEIIENGKRRYITEKEWDGLSFKWFFDSVEDISKNPPYAKGYVYLAEKESGTVKIGKCVNPKSRLGSLATQGNFSIKRSHISPTLKNNLEIERKMHQRFKKERLKGEWFSVPFELLVESLNNLIDEEGVLIN